MFSSKWPTLYCLSLNAVSLSCPIPLKQYPTILLAHGGGGRLMHQLISQLFLATFGRPEQPQHDAAVLTLPGNRIAFTTDSYVVSPMFFPGGDIGILAVNGTVNDLAMAGARPLYLSLGFILEEGLPMETLWRVVQSIQAAAERAQVRIVTGDTKVVDRGKGDGLFINTAGVGIVEHGQTIAPNAVIPGDVVLLNGDVGRHGIAVMAQREGLAFESDITSDTAPVAQVVSQLLQAGIEIHCLRDATRGGLASTLNEIATAAQVHITLNETAIPVQADVQGACEILGLDPLYIANEGRFIAFVPAAQADAALAILQADQIAKGELPNASAIGRVTAAPSPLVTLTNRLGTDRILDVLSGEQLPRIC
ncbi:MAG: hydrogenase expression/formation protein HypE [Leptolyngbya sp. RL_3_1]|nr:hydrogenase expression/formation protein HypE [Leptolyngbya sp. RL_3_1]